MWAQTKDNWLFFCRKDANSALLSNYEVNNCEVDYCIFRSDGLPFASEDY